jgi:predicted extracellular nuclease
MQRRALAAALGSLLLALAGCNAVEDGTTAPSSTPAAAVAPAVRDHLPLGAVQGRGTRSPLEGERVEVQGIVTGNFVAGLDGFFLQDAAGEDDGDPLTSDAVFVHWPRGSAPKVRRGDRVRVAGSVAERGQAEDVTTTIEATEVAAMGRGALAARVIDKPPAALADWERLEGMWLRFAAPLTVSGNHGLVRFGELVASFGGRQWQPTERHPPGPQAKVALDDALRQRLVLDDNRDGEFPEKLWFLPDGLSADHALRTGSELHEVEGILEQRFGWRLQLTASLDHIEYGKRPAAPELPPGLRVGSFNVLNWFNGDGKGKGFPTERGASDAAEAQRQLDKLVASIGTLRPDVAALMELENDGYDRHSSIAALVAALNKKLGEGEYAFVDAGEGPGGDAIRVGIIYRPATVVPKGKHITLDTFAFADRNRVSLAQAFAPKAGGEAFVVAANHFKSKGGCDEAVDPGDRDARDGQGCWNATRVQAAKELSAWLADNPTGQGPRTLLLGDLNSYGQEDPVRTLREAGWRDAFEIVGAKRPYSFVYDGWSGRLDHAFANEGLAPFVAHAMEWHVNADESEAFDYNREQHRPEWYAADAYRSSDHDPLIVVLDFARR